MSVKTTGVEFRAFVNSDSWDWWDGTLFSLNGEETDDIDDSILTPDDKIVIISGVVYCSQDGDGKDAVSFFRQWQKRRKTTTLAIEFDTSRLDEVEALLNQHSIGVVR